MIMFSSFLILAYHVILLVEFGFQRATEARVVTNKMRYGQSGYNGQRSPNLSTEQQVFELAEATRLFTNRASPSENMYKINRDSAKFHEGKLLDEEDRSLLEKFYRETKQNDPFLGDSLSTESLWDELDNDKALDPKSALLDTHQQVDKAYDQVSKEAGKALGAISEWTVDPEYLPAEKGFSNERPNFYNNNVPTGGLKIIQASYSPTLRLLTSYDPIEDLKVITEGGPTPTGAHGITGALSHKTGDRIVGATLFGNDESSRPSVSSKSALDAVKLHDDLLKAPPRDGKVRVRMYYHRAIHDDARLYGNGPWKYWGHGWGLEFGFDPKSQASNNDFYQRGYTIERAFGRDFCKHRNNCRHPDPDFFKYPHKVGEYSEQQHRTMGPEARGFAARDRDKNLLLVTASQARIV